METYEFGDKGLVKLGDLDEMLEELVEGIKEYTKGFVIDSMCMHPLIEKEYASLEGELVDDVPQCESESVTDYLIAMGHISGTWRDTQRIIHQTFFGIRQLHQRSMSLKPPRHLTSGKHGYRIRKWVK